MKFVPRILAAAAALTALACAKETTEPYRKFEDLSLRAWITQHRPALLDNYQAFDDEAGYYLDLHDAGDLASEPINDTARWIRFNFTGRDLAGNIVLTRNAREAELAGTFTKYTHYVPYYRYCGTSSYSFIEGTWLAMEKKQTLGERYYADNGELLGLTSREYEMRIGARATLYMPSRVVGNGLSGDGGYEGQYSLESGKPLIVTMEICDTVKNPLQREGSEVDAYCDLNGGRQVYSHDEKDTEAVKLPTSLDDPNHPYRSDFDKRWVSACDSVAQLYVNYRFDPKSDRLSYPEPYHVGIEPYADAQSVRSIDDRIAEVLVKRFHADEPYAGIEALKADSVGLDGTAKIWYIGRFLDGFIFDTNIDEVKQIIYGEVKDTGSALSYKPSEGGLITAFYYAIPNMQYGQWGALITTSTNGYGASGQSGSTSTETSGYSSSYYDYMNYLNYYNYYNSYYGGYGSYYNNYYGGYGGYGGYYGGYYDPYYSSYYGSYANGYYGSTDNDTTVTTRRTSTEIPSFTPLIFEFYIEPAK